MLSIAQAAQLLKVSTKTLRRWEKQGLLVPTRSAGNQRRYGEEQIKGFTKPPRVSLAPLASPSHLEGGATPGAHLPGVLSNQQKKILIGAVASLVMAISAVGISRTNFPQTALTAISALRGGAATADHLEGVKFPHLPGGSAVLAAETATDDYLFSVSAESQFAQDVIITGDLTAPNILYDLTEGLGIDISGGQSPTITATDLGSAQKIFKTIKTGSTEFSAGSNTDTLTFTGGTGISISGNTTDKKLTISASASDLNISGWTDDGTLVRLSTAGDIVSLGSATGSAKLAIEGGGTDRDIFTASQSGNLLLKLTNTGLLTLADDLAVNGGDLTTTQNTFNLLNATATTINFAGAATTLSLGATTGTTTINNDLTIGNAITDAITFTARVAQDSDLIPITATGTNDLGSSALPWDNLYLTATTGDVFYASTTNTMAKLGIGSDGQTLIVSSGVPIWAGSTGSGTVGWWQRNLGVLSPTNITDDLAVGGTATSSALFQADGLTGNITTAGDIAVNGADITTTSTGTATVFNTTATTVNLAGAGTTISIGAGSGNTTINNSAVVTGDLGVNGGDITSSATSFNLLQSTVTTLNLGGAATTVSLGASTGTTTINNANTIISGDLAVNGGDLTTSATTFNLVNATVTTLNLAGAATTLGIGAATGTTTINNALSVLGSFTLGDNGDTGSIDTSDWDVSTTGDLTGIGAITSNGAISFTPGTTTDITFTTDTDSTFVVSGLATSTGSGLCLDGSDNMIICSSGSGSSLWTLSTSTIYPNLASYDSLIGSSTATDGVGKFTVSGAKTGKALVVLNETGNQNILEASASGVPIFSLERDGDLVFEGATNNDFETILAVSDPSADRTVTIPNATGTICLDSDNCTGGTAGPWGETSGVVVLDTSTNNVTVGSSSNLGKLGVDGDTDEVQLLVQANSSQTANLLTLENSSGTDQSWFDETGNLRVGAAAADTGLVNVTGAFTGKALVILDETGDQAIWTASASGTTVATLGRTGNLTLTDSSSSNIDFNLSSTGDFTISDAGTPFATFSDTGYLDLDSLRLDGTTIGLTTDTDLLSLAANELTVNGSIVATADVAVNGGDLTSTATTFNLLQSTVTTLNLGGAATTVSLGASTGTTTINNANTIISGDLAVNGGDLTTSATTFNLVNATVTTLNLGGAATTNLNAVTLSGHLTLSSDASEGLSGGGLTDCDTAATSKLLWDTTTNKFSCGTDQNSGGGGSNWRITSGALSPINDTLDVLIGNSASASAKFAFINVNSGTPTASVSGNLTLDAAGVIATTAKQTLTIGDANTGNIAIGPNSNVTTIGNSTTSTALNFTSGTGAQTFASSVATGTTTSSAFVFSDTALTSGTGLYLTSSSLTTGKMIDINTASANTLTSGTLFNLATTATSLTSGSLAVFDWSPGSATTATGDLFKINIGANGATTGDLFVVGDAGSDLFSVSETAITSSLPHSFTAAGDVSLAYDLIFTNQTASYLKSNAPLYIEAGESFENNNLTLKTYGTGQIVTDGSFNGTNITSRDDETAASTNTITGRGMVYYLHADSNTTNTTFTTTYDVTGVPDVYGTVVFINSVAEKGISSGSVAHTVAVQINGTQVSSVVTATQTGADTAKESYTIVRSYDGWKIVGSTGTSDSADYAEVYRTADDVESAEVVALTAGEELKVERASSATIDRVIGVTSTSPASIIGEEFDLETKKIAVGLSGRLPVKISSSSAPIQIGDVLTASNDAGKATKATRPGRTIGKALESWTAGSGKDRVLMFIENSWADPNQFLAFDESGNLTIPGSLTTQNLIVKDNPADPLAPEIASWRDSLSTINSQLLGLTDQVASLSAQLASLQLQSDPAASLPADLNWEISTASGRLVTAYAVQVPELTIAGQLHVGLLTVDDLTSTLSSLLGEITIAGDLAITGKIRVLGDSAGTATIPAGEIEAVVETLSASPTSRYFVTPKEAPIAIATSATQSGEFIVKIAAAQLEDLLVDWWIID